MSPRAIAAVYRLDPGYNPVMSRLVSRILLSMIMCPLATVTYMVVVILLDRSGNDNSTFIIADLVTWGFVALYWCLLWRQSVDWTGLRIGGTFLAAFGALLVGSVIGGVVDAAAFVGDESLGIFIGGIATISIWIAATIVIWRETSAERAQRLKRANKSAITCPTCGYNLTGLSEARCPECGTKYTLDELMARQVKVDREIEAV
jgi:hypothetical protein